MHDGLLYFTAMDGSFQQNLWKSDGTTAGTTVAANFAPGFTGFFIPSTFMVIGQTAVFADVEVRGAAPIISGLAVQIMTDFAGSLPKGGLERVDREVTETAAEDVRLRGSGREVLTVPILLDERAGAHDAQNSRSTSTQTIASATSSPTSRNVSSRSPARTC